MTESALHTYTVQGMSCEHCRSAVLAEVGAVEGVESVEVDLSTGRLDVRGGDLSDERIKSAVEEAGYELAGAD